MKKIAFILTLGLLVSIGASAQKTNLKGPAYKNRKPWKNPTPTTLVFTKSGETLKGPAAKNATPLQRKQGEKVLVAVGNDGPKLKGPEYKNRKPWADNSLKLYAEEPDKSEGNDGGTTGSK